MTAVKGVVGAGRPRTVGSASRRGGKHQPLGSIEQDEDEERSRVLKTKLPLSLSLKQAWSTTSQDASPTADMKFDEFQKIEDCIHRHNLEKIRRRFEEGDGHALDLGEFTAAFEELLGVKGRREQVKAFFEKIDYNSQGFIDWNGFCSHIYLELHEQDDAKVRSKEVKFVTPANQLSGPHKDSLCRISHMNDGCLASCSQDGVVCFWSQDYRPRRKRLAEIGQLGKPKWVTDMALCINQSKLMLTTGDCEIQFYELANFEPYCQLRKLESIPLRACFWSNAATGHQECIIFIGDKQGCVTVIIAPNIYEAFKYWKLGSKAEGIPTYQLERLLEDTDAGCKIFRWSLHSELVCEIHYFSELNSFASCSSDSQASLVLASPSGSTPPDLLTSTGYGGGSRLRATVPTKCRISDDHKVFKVSKGVSTVDFCPSSTLVVTGSVDELIRIWNPFLTSKPVATLAGHGSPLFSVIVDSGNNRLFSLSSNNTLKVWDLVDYNCLCTLLPTSHKCTGIVEAAYYNPVSRALALGGDQLAILRLQEAPGVSTSVIQSHKGGLVGVQYTPYFKYIVTACDKAVMKVWDLMTGACLFEFSADFKRGGGITAIDIDESGRRLVGGGEKGEIKLWNFNNGQCIQVLDKGNNAEVTDVKFVTVNKNRYIVAVGWDKRVNLFADTGESLSQMQRPIEAWISATEYRHKEDILCVAFGSQFMATSSYDGKIIVWSMVSGRPISKLNVLDYNTGHLGAHEGLVDASVHKVLFLQTRIKSEEAASLVATSLQGCVYFWNHRTAALMGKFSALTNTISSMALDGSDSILIAGGIEELAHWKAHNKEITSIKFIDNWNILVTASSESSAKLWTLNGTPIGTFGQTMRWSLTAHTSYQQSLPHTLFIGQGLSEVTALPPPVALHPSSTTSPTASKQHHGAAPNVPVINDLEDNEGLEVLDDLSDMAVPQTNDTIRTGSVGKRLRHLRSAAAGVSSGRHGVYSSLPCQALQDTSRTNY
eukprot:Em0026g50a